MLIVATLAVNLVRPRSTGWSSRLASTIWVTCCAFIAGSCWLNLVDSCGRLSPEGSYRPVSALMVSQVAGHPSRWAPMLRFDQRATGGHDPVSITVSAAPGMDHCIRLVPRERNHQPSQSMSNRVSRHCNGFRLSDLCPLPHEAHPADHHNMPDAGCQV